MTNKSLILNLYNQTINYLDLTFLDSNLIELVKTKDDFKQIITNLLTFVVDCEDQEFVEEKNQQRLLAAFSAITGNEFVANTMMNYKTDEELDAEVKGFDSYLVQNLDKNFEEIKEEFHSKHVEEPVKVESEVVGVAPVTSTTAATKGNQPKNDEHEQKEFDAEEFFQNNKTAINDLTESMITTAANQLLMGNIRRGSVYKFKTKPRIIPIIKWIMVGLIAALMVLSIASFAVLMVASNHIVYEKYENGKPTGDFITGYQLTSPMPFQLLLTILIMFMMVSTIIRGNKNENAKFYFNWKSMLVYISVLILTWFLLGGIGSFIFQSIDKYLEGIHADLQKSAYGRELMSVYKIIQFVIIGLLGVMIILLVVGAVFNPKNDDERLSKLLDEYCNDIKSGSMPFDASAGSFGNFMGSWF